MASYRTHGLPCCGPSEPLVSDSRPDFYLTSGFPEPRLVASVPLAGGLGCPLPVKPGLCRYVRTCVLGFRHGGAASGLVESLLPGAMQQRARVGTGQDHRELDAV